MEDRKEMQKIRRRSPVSPRIGGLLLTGYLVLAGSTNSASLNTPTDLRQPVTARIEAASVPADSLARHTAGFSGFSDAALMVCLGSGLLWASSKLRRLTTPAR